MHGVSKAAALLFVGTVLLAGCGSPQGTVEGFYRAIDAGNIDKALDYFDPGTKKTWDGKLVAHISSQVEKASKCGGISEIKTETVSERGDLQIVKARVTFKKDGPECDQISDKFKLIKTDGSWRIILN